MEHHRWPAITRSSIETQTRPSLRAPRRDQPCSHLDFRLLASRMERECISVILSHSLGKGYSWLPPFFLYFLGKYLILRVVHSGHENSSFQSLCLRIMGCLRFLIVEIPASKPEVLKQWSPTFLVPVTSAPMRI